MITGDLIVSGHNNIFNGLKIAEGGNILDSGLTNKYNDCYQISGINGAQQSQGMQMNADDSDSSSQEDEEEVEEYYGEEEEE